MPIEKAVKALNKAFEEHFRAGCPEADSCLNSASRHLIKAFLDTSEAWLLDINTGSYVRWDECTATNFCATHVLPKFDAELQQMILERLQTPYTGISADAARIKEIAKKIVELEGEVLLWS